MGKFIHLFMENDGTPQSHTSKECMEYLKNIGYTFNEARGIIGRAVSHGFIKCIFESGTTKIYI